MQIFRCYFAIGTTNCEGLAIDWLGNNIYWTDESKKTVSVASLRNTSLRHVLIDTNLTHPRAIVLNPRSDKGYVHVTTPRAH